MWRTLLVLSLASLAAPAAAAAQSPSDRAADDEAVRSVIGKYVEAREARDPQAIEALFTSDADQHTTSGEWRRGRDEVIRGSLESSQRNQGKRGIRIEMVRFITPDVAIADGPYEIATEGGVRRMWTTIVLERERGAWRVTAIRNMVPAASAAAPSR